MHLQHHLDELPHERGVEGPRDADVVAGVAFHEAIAVGGLEQHLLADAAVGFKEL